MSAEPIVVAWIKFIGRFDLVDRPDIPGYVSFPSEGKEADQLAQSGRVSREIIFKSNMFLLDQSLHRDLTDIFQTSASECCRIKANLRQAQLDSHVIGDSATHGMAGQLKLLALFTQFLVEMLRQLECLFVHRRDTTNAQKLLHAGS